jgi:hypothetical protein
MLTTDSSSNANTLSQTSTESLEEQLHNILNQDGGAKKKSKKQNGGNFSATANSSTAQDVNKLISMLTTDSSSNANTLSQTSTESLEEQLRNILNQDGGAKKKSKKQKGGNEGEVKIDDVKKFFMSLKSQGVNVDVKLNNQTMSEFFGLAQNTTTDMPKLSEVSSATSSINIQDIIGTDNQSGGAKKKKSSNKASKKSSKKGSKKSMDGDAKKKKSSNKASKKSSKKGSKKSMDGGAKKKKSSNKASKKSSKKGSKKSMDGGVNPGFQAFLDLKKHIAEKLGISNGPQAAKVAGAVQKDMKEKHPDKDAVTIAQEGMKHFDANMEHYKQMLPK